MRLVLSREEANILYSYLKGKRIGSVREYIVLQDIMSRLEEVTENKVVIEDEDWIIRRDDTHYINCAC